MGGPVTARERIQSIDVLRGFALLGILVMNIPWFARSESAFFDPRRDGGFEGADYFTWLISRLFFDMKMMTIFSMLFGAGMIIMTERALAARGKAAGLYYRRLFWLLMFGLAHAYLLWAGDILYSYALCGLVIYPLRRLRPVWLVMIAGVLLFIGNAINMSSGFFFDFARTTATEAQSIIDAGGTPDGMQQGMLEAWNGIAADFSPDAAALAEERDAHLGSYGDLFAFRAEQAFFMQTGLFFIFLFWRATGVMLLGMALLKWGVVSAERSMKFYAVLALIGYGIGLPIVAAGLWLMHQHDFDFVRAFQYDWSFNFFGSIAVALGHIGLVMLVCKSGVLAMLRRSLAAVGQMALTNYLMHSVICATIFYGWGFGQWGSLSRFETMGVVLGIWVFQLAYSPLWLRVFRFGPAEWLWRSLTYWTLQPMRRATSAG